MVFWVDLSCFSWKEKDVLVALLQLVSLFTSRPQLAPIAEQEDFDDAICFPPLLDRLALAHLAKELPG